MGEEEETMKDDWAVKEIITIKNNVASIEFSKGDTYINVYVSSYFREDLTKDAKELFDHAVKAKVKSAKVEGYE